MAEDIIKGSDGRSYRRQKDGRLAEVYDPKAHAKRLHDSITAKHVVSGIRLADPSDPNGEGVVVTFAEAESRKIVAAVKDLLKAR